MLVAGKVWGRTAQLFATPAFELHRIVAQPGHKCSKHKHSTKVNGFFVETGKLRVTVWQPTGTVDVTELGPGDTIAVPPGVYHQFQALEPDTVAFEVYWTELRADDIERETVGE